MDATDALVEVLWSEGLRVLATLARTVGDLAVAEDALSEATITALDRWPATGIPDDPRAWRGGAGPDRGGDRGDGARDVPARRHAAPDLHLLPPGARP